MTLASATRRPVQDELPATDPSQPGGVAGVGQRLDQFVVAQPPPSRLLRGRRHALGQVWFRLDELDHDRMVRRPGRDDRRRRDDRYRPRGWRGHDHHRRGWLWRHSTVSQQQGQQDHSYPGDRGARRLPPAAAMPRLCLRVLQDLGTPVFAGRG